MSANHCDLPKPCVIDLDSQTPKNLNEHSYISHNRCEAILLAGSERIVRKHLCDSIHDVLT
jgi:hypothetical protein